MTHIVSPSETTEHLTRLLGTLDPESEYAADVQRSIDWLQSFEAINLDRLAKYVTGGEDFALSLPDMANMIRDRIADDYQLKPTAPPKPVRIRTKDGMGNVAYISKMGSYWRLTSDKGVPLALSNLFKDEPALRFALEDATTPDQALAACRKFSSYSNTVLELV